jgi:DNA adenine methylase
VEPFGGAASVLMRKWRCYAEVYNDLDGELVNLFTVARDRGSELISRLTLTPFSRTEFETSYESSTDSIEQARRTVVRSFMGFGSNSHNKATGFRANSNRSGTTPAHDWMNYPECLRVTIDRLRGIVIENREAIKVMLAHDGPDTLHYVDPPYVKSTRDSGTDYRHEMTDEDHRELSKVLNSLDGMVIVSGYNSPLYEEMYGDWKSVKREAMADGARPRTEVLWMRNISKQLDIFDQITKT